MDVDQIDCSLKYEKRDRRMRMELFVSDWISDTCLRGSVSMAVLFGLGSGFRTGALALDSKVRLKIEGVKTLLEMIYEVNFRGEIWKRVVDGWSEQEISLFV